MKNHEDSLSACPSPDILMAWGEDVLPPDMARQVEEHLAACLDCARLRRDLAEPEFTEPTLADLDRLRRKVAAATGAPLSGSAAPASSHSYYWMAAVAVLFALAVAASYSWRRLSPTRQVAPVAVAAPPSTVTAAPTPPPAPFRLTLEHAPLRLPFSAIAMRGETAPPASDEFLRALGRALEPYFAGRYAEAVTSLAALSIRYPSKAEPQFYEGVARLLAGDARAAVAPLERARSIGGIALRDDLLWYLAIAYERTSRWEKAKALLHDLCHFSGGEGINRQAACAGLAAR